jgi:hypothetical protein
MRTKTLLLTAALSAAGIATSMAQVYSVNAVGYVNVQLVPGFTLVANPLDNKSGNSIQNLFGTGIQGTIPGGTTVYYFENGNFGVATYDDLDQAFGPADAASRNVLVGEGVFVRNPGTTALTCTFVGEVPQGNLTTPLPSGYSIKGSPVPQEGTASDLGLQGAPGDTIYQFDPATQNYRTPSTFDELDNTWVPALTPLKVGEAFFFRNAGAAKNWTRTFSVSQ